MSGHDRKSRSRHQYQHDDPPSASASASVTSSSSGTLHVLGLAKDMQLATYARDHKRDRDGQRDRDDHHDRHSRSDGGGGRRRSRDYNYNNDHHHHTSGYISGQDDASFGDRDSDNNHHISRRYEYNYNHHHRGSLVSGWGGSQSQSTRTSRHTYTTDELTILSGSHSTRYYCGSNTNSSNHRTSKNRHHSSSKSSKPKSKSKPKSNNDEPSEATTYDSRTIYDDEEYYHYHHHHHDHDHEGENKNNNNDNGNNNGHLQLQLYDKEKMENKSSSNSRATRERESGSERSHRHHHHHPDDEDGERGRGSLTLASARRRRRRGGSSSHHDHDADDADAYVHYTENNDDDDDYHGYISGQDDDAYYDDGDGDDVVSNDYYASEKHSKRRRNNDHDDDHDHDDDDTTHQSSYSSRNRHRIRRSRSRTSISHVDEDEEEEESNEDIIKARQRRNRYYERNNHHHHHPRWRNERSGRFRSRRRDDDDDDDEQSQSSPRSRRRSFEERSVKTTSSSSASQHDYYYSKFENKNNSENGSSRGGGGWKRSNDDDDDQLSSGGGRSYNNDDNSRESMKDQQQQQRGRRGQYYAVGRQRGRVSKTKSRRIIHHKDSSSSSSISCSEKSASVESGNDDDDDVGTTRSMSSATRSRDHVETRQFSMASTTRRASLPLPSHPGDDDDSSIASSSASSSSSSSINLLKLRIWYKHNIAPYWKLASAQLFCMVYILILTFSDWPLGLADPDTGDIIGGMNSMMISMEEERDISSIDGKNIIIIENNIERGVIYLNGVYRPVVAIGDWQKICLAISRMSAFSMYPMLVVVFVTKMKAIQTFFSKTPLSMYLGIIKESHDYHVHAGRYIAFDVWVHTAFHLLRWLSQGNLILLLTSAAGLTGFLAVVLTPLIAFPMMYYKDKLRYEVRKGLHYLFYLFAIALCFHVPPSAIPNGGFIAPILGTCIVMYTLDAMYVYIFMTEKIETTSFHVLSCGVRISMPVSERFRKHSGRAGYAYICIPWINDKQWHPFSLFEDPSDPSTQQMFLMKNGDWTNAVHDALARDTTRPCWIKGPFPSPYSHAALYDNQVLVASGIGITPALAAINAFKSSRRINLIWAVRDPEMLEFFLEHMYLDHDGWNLIFYTGKELLSPTIEESNANVRVVNGRPQLSTLIPNIIYGNESESPEFDLWEESEEQITHVKELDEHVMSSWGMMYCGGSKGVLSALQEISVDYSIDLHIDSFAW